jgi:hypothetical protein
LVKFYAGVAEDLILYARQLGWFHSIPEKPKSHKQSAEKTKPVSRGEKIKANGGTLLMPPLHEAEYIIQYWQSMGMVESGFNGPIPLSSKEIQAWAQGLSLELSPWEFQILRDISKAYIVELREAESLERLPPYGDPVNEFDRATVSKQLGSAFKALILAKGNNGNKRRLPHD